MASKKPMFTNKEKGYQTPSLNAKKLSGKGDTAVYETAEECMARVKDLFDIDDVECFWDEENKRYVAGPMPEDMKESTDKTEPADEEPETPEETVMTQDEESELTEEADDTTVSDDEQEALEESSDEKPKTADSDFEDTEARKEPLPSKDGKRSYDLSESRGLQSLKTLLNNWSWDEGEDALVAKIEEELMELKTGTTDAAEIDGSPGKQTVSVIGVSRISECITVAIVCFKLAHQFYGIDPVMMAKLMHLRHQEQYDRYRG